MKISTLLTYGTNPREAADHVVELEAAGLDTVWVAEGYGFDSPTLMGFLAARTSTVEIGAAILNIYSRTPTMLASTAAGLDSVSDGRQSLVLAPPTRRSSRAGTDCPSLRRSAGRKRPSRSSVRPCATR